MTRHERYYGPRAVPCACGSHEAYWHGPDAYRTYSCDACYEIQQQAERDRRRVVTETAQRIMRASREC